MLQKQKNWLAETLWKPKKTHSLEQLRYLYYILQRNSTVTESNKHLLVETLRSIAEILIWGDQNDSTVFDFFLEKNMLLFFLKFMTQNCGSYVTVQLLQTLNILFENIRHETSLYFLFSNNHVNSIIVHKFDFSNEEVMAYYISFLKTLSLKLNMHIINFFFNERKCDFPLYTEGIKFFHHPENMVRIAVRTLTLNVYKVGHDKMLEFIVDKTATPYFSNLIWFIGKHAIELDDCLIQETDHFKVDKLKDLVANHLDHLHYLQDILSLKIKMLNVTLTDHMINRLLIPLYVYSLPKKEQGDQSENDRVRISQLCSLFLLVQHMLIMDDSQLVNSIIDVIFNEDDIRSSPYPVLDSPKDSRGIQSHGGSSTLHGPVRAFIPPPAPLESQLEAFGVMKDNYNLPMKLEALTQAEPKNRKKTSVSSPKSSRPTSSTFYVEHVSGEIKQSRRGNDSDTDSVASHSSNSTADDALNLLSQQAAGSGSNSPMLLPKADKQTGSLEAGSTDTTRLLDETVDDSIEAVHVSVSQEQLTLDGQKLEHPSDDVDMESTDEPRVSTGKEISSEDVSFDQLAKKRENVESEFDQLAKEREDEKKQEKDNTQLNTNTTNENEHNEESSAEDQSETKLPLVEEVNQTKPTQRFFLKSILQTMDCSEGDCEAFFALCLIYTIMVNKGLDKKFLQDVGLALPKDSPDYSDEILERLLWLLEDGVRDDSRMRLVTFEILIKVIRLLILDGDTKRIKDNHRAIIENIKESSTLQLRSFYKGDDLFVDTFEGEYHQLKAKKMNMEYMTMDATLLLPPTQTPLTGIDFSKRLPCGDSERTRRAAHVFILMRELILDLDGEQETLLPLSKIESPVKENDVLDLNNSDLIACTIVQPNKQSVRRFMVIDQSQFILVEPDTSKLGWGVVKFVSHLQDVEANPDKDDSRSLNIVVQKPLSWRTQSGINPLPLLTAKFVFDDYIRCMSARQRLQKRRDILRHQKMSYVTRLLQLPMMAAPPAHYYSISAPFDSGTTTVWSPSARGHTAQPRSVKSSPSLGDATPIDSKEKTRKQDLHPPKRQGAKKLLSPQLQEILQKQKNDSTNGRFLT